MGFSMKVNIREEICTHKINSSQQPRSLSVRGGLCLPQISYCAARTTRLDKVKFKLIFPAHPGGKCGDTLRMQSCNTFFLSYSLLRFSDIKINKYFALLLLHSDSINLKSRMLEVNLFIVQ